VAVRPRALVTTLFALAATVGAGVRGGRPVSGATAHLDVLLRSAAPNPAPPVRGHVGAVTPASHDARARRCSSIERREAGRCVPACPDGEVYVPAPPPEGFWLGRGEPGAADQRHRVILTQPFCMDATEVTVAAYRDCVEHRGCPLPRLGDVNSNYRWPDRDRHPVNMVALDDALAYCGSVDKDLPTEAEWVWAAGHGDGRRYPWGDEAPTCDNGRADFTPGGAPKSDPAGNVGCHGGGTSPVGAHAAGKSAWPSGDLYDLGGNVWEWTRDCSAPFPARTVVDPRPVAHPRLAGECYVFVLLGGGWNRSAVALEIDWRAAAVRNYRVPGLGFRCVRRPR